MAGVLSAVFHPSLRCIIGGQPTHGQRTANAKNAYNTDYVATA